MDTKGRMLKTNKKKLLGIELKLMASTAKRQKTASPNAPDVTARAADPPIDNRYAGFVLPEAGWPVPRVTLAPSADSTPSSTAAAITSCGLTPRQFFAQYIATRKPCVVAGGIPHLDPRFRGHELWNDGHLKSVAGDSEVRVEQRAAAVGDSCGASSSSGSSSSSSSSAPVASFGRGNNVRMPFGAFVDLVAAGDERHYMTTQDLDVDEDGRPALLSPPCSDLLAAGDFPLRPRVMGNLILMNANMWYGNSAAGSSSGLHHDFHDNLYVLLRGKKRFRLFSPRDAHRMYTTGRMAMVHPNGRICYDGLMTGADGADVASIKAMEAEKEQAVAAEDADRAQRALEAGEGGAEGWVRRAEARMEAAMDAVL